MQLRRAGAIVAACAATLAGCASQPAEVAPGTHVQMMADLRAGKLVLACGPACRDTWNRQLEAISFLNQAERWSELTLRVMRIGYGSDLAYYTLGEAAEGMGYHRAAAGYFTQARAVADSSDDAMQCGGAGTSENRCGGIRIAEAAGIQAAAARDTLEREAAGSAPSHRPVRAHASKTRVGALAHAGAPHAARPKDAEPLVAGLAQAIDTATLQVRGRTIPLAGITGRPDSYAAQLQALIDAHGNTVRCVPTGSRYACTLRNGLDVASAALASGLATVTADAPEVFRAQQQAARAAHRGLWRVAAGASG